VSLTRWFADNAQQILADEEFEREGEQGKFMYDPIGVIFGIAPWNFPFNQVLRAAIPNTIAGNTTVYKHASNVPQCAARIEKLFLDAGFPQGVYTNMFISSWKSERVLSNKYITGTNLT
jgi:succinate-semialdehyde dehydrogenase/glutarate-semialdehyde dehydrogenase